RARIAREHALRGDISATEIFAQKESDARIERAFVKPVHDSASLGARASCPQSARSTINESLLTTAPPTSDREQQFAGQYRRRAFVTQQPYRPAHDSQNRNYRAAPRASRPLFPASPSLS